MNLKQDAVLIVIAIIALATGYTWIKNGIKNAAGAVVDGLNAAGGAVVDNTMSPFTTPVMPDESAAQQTLDSLNNLGRTGL